MPSERRCAGIYGEGYRQRPELRGTQCTQDAEPDSEFCRNHKPLTDTQRCIARLSKNHPTHPGERCTCRAMTARTVCGIHGGKTPQAIAGAKRRIAEKKAEALVSTYGLKIETTATEALLDEVKWTAGHVRWLRDRVQEIEQSLIAEDGTVPQHPLIWGRTKRKTGGDDWGETHEAGANAWLKLYQAERTHLVKVCSEAIRAGIEERRVKLAEEDGAMVAQVIRAILGDLNLTPEQWARVPQIVPRHLRALAT